MKPPRGRRADAILEKLEGQHPGAFTELHFRNPTSCSSRRSCRRSAPTSGSTRSRRRSSSDTRTRARWRARRRPSSSRRFSPPASSASKSKALAGMASALVEKHGGEVPARMEELVELPGVGRKTANVVLGHALGVPGLPVDRHVLRVANRIGIARVGRSGGRRAAACAMLPAEKWTLRVRHADPARTAHLQAEAVVRALRGDARTATITASSSVALADSRMQRKRFERLVDHAVATIPRKFRDALQNLAIVVEDEPSGRRARGAGDRPR